MFEPIAHRKVPEKKSRGASLVEYSLLIAFVIMAAALGIRALGTGISQQFSEVGSLVIHAH